MAELNVTRLTILQSDTDGDGVADPGDTLRTTVTISNTTIGDMYDVTLTDTLTGSTLTGGVNVSPLASNDVYSAIGNTLLLAGGATASGAALVNLTKLTANDIDFLGDTFKVEAGIVSSAQGGSVTLYDNGAFSYISAAGFTGTDTFTYTIRDKGLDGIAGNADDLTSTATVTVNVANQVWYVDGTSGNDTTGDGTSLKPFATVTKAGTVDGTLDVIYVKGSATGQLTMEQGERLIGTGVDLVVGGQTLATASSNSTVTGNGAYTVTLAASGGNEISGINIAGTAGISGSNFGTLNVKSATINTTGQALSLTTGSVTNTGFTSVTSAGGANNVLLDNVSGTVNLGTGSLAGATGVAFWVKNGSASVDYDGSISHTSNGAALLVSGQTGGTVRFDGAVSSTSLSDGIGLSSNTGATVAFTGALTIDTSASNTDAFQISGGGTVTATGAGSTISSGSGKAVGIANTTIGADGITFQSVTVNGGTNAIVLNNTGSSGAFSITGTGTSTSSTAGTVAAALGTGGTIQNTSGDAISITGATGGVTLKSMIIGNAAANQTIVSAAVNVGGNGIHLVNSDNIVLQNVFIGDTGGHGIDGQGVTNLSLINTSIINSGDIANEDGINFSGESTNQLDGLVLISNSVIATSFSDNIDVANTSGTLHFTLTGSKIDRTSSSISGQNGVKLETSGSAQAFVDIASSTISNNNGDGVELSAYDTSNLQATVRNNTLSNGSGGILAWNSDSATLTVKIDNNTITAMEGSSIFVGHPLLSGGSASSLQATISNNVITAPATAFQHAISAALSSATGQISQSRLLITGNTITQNSTAGVRAILVDTPDPGATPNFYATVTNNSVTATDSFAPTMISVAARNGATGHSDVRGNSVTYTSAAGVTGINVRETTGSSNELARGISASNDSGVVLAANNPLATTTVLPTATDIPVVENATIILPATPTLPTLPLLVSALPGEPDVETSGEGATGGVRLTVTAPGATDAPEGSAPTITSAALGELIDAAIARWAAAGASEAQLAAMKAVDISLAELGGFYLGKSASGTIVLDDDAAGFGWFVDATPDEDTEFAEDGGELAASGGSDAVGKIDLLTAIMHELGHQIGLADEYGGVATLMAGIIDPGERRLPDASDLLGASGLAVEGAFALSPVNIGTLPAGRTITVQYDSIVNSFSNEKIPSILETAEVNAVTESGTANASGDEPLVIDTLTLGDLVFNDDNGNGLFDAGDNGVDGVTLTLFADDGTTPGELDAGDTEIDTATTSGGGLYSFTSLAPGDYIVRVDAGNFASGGVLEGATSSPGGNDPDDNVDNDSNAGAVASGSASLPITLDYNTEPTAGMGNDTNNTLDFGFDVPNKPPVNTVPGAAQVYEDHSLFINAGFGVTDADDTSLTVTLSAQHGTITINPSGLSFLTGDGLADATMTFSGSKVAIKSALALVTYKPNLNFVGDDAIQIISDDGEDTDTDTSGTIEVLPVNDPPQGTDGTVTWYQDAPYVFKASDFGFTDPIDGDAMSAVVITTLPSVGTIRVDGLIVGAPAEVSLADLDAGKLTFTPVAGQTGDPYTSLTFQVRDDGGTANGGISLDQSPNTLQIDILPNDPPSVTNDVVDADEDVEANYAASLLLANDTDSDSDTLEITSVFNSVNGTATLEADGSVTFLGAADFFGVAGFDYSISDGKGGKASGHVTVNVAAVDDPPKIIVPGSGSIDEDTFLDFNSAFTITDDSAGNLTVTMAVAHGALTVSNTSGLVSITGNGTEEVTFTGSQSTINATTLSLLKYVPDQDFNGTDAVQVSVTALSGGLESSRTSGDIIVNPVNDAPEITAPTSQIAYKGQPLVFSLANGNELSVSDVDAGSASLLFQLSTVNGNTGANFFLIGSGGTITFTGTLSQLNGALGSLFFNPDPGFTGSASIQISINDNGNSGSGGAQSDIVTINIDVIENAAPVLDATKAPVLASVLEDPGAPTGAVGTLVSSLVDYASPTGQLDNVTDPTGPGLGIAVIDVASNGKLWYSLNDGATWLQLASSDDANALLLKADATTRVYLEPGLNVNGDISDAITFRAWDTLTGTNGGTADTSGANNGGETSFSSETDFAAISVTSVNDAPEATGSSITLLEDSTYTMKLSDFGFSDVDGDNFDSITLAQPAGTIMLLDGVELPFGAVVSAADIAAGKLVFATQPNLTGSFVHVFEVRDDGGTANGGENRSFASISFTVTPVNDAPSGTDKTVGTQEDTTYTFALADFGFSDALDSPANAFAAVKITTLPGDGSLELAGVPVMAGDTVPAASITAGDLRFVPDANSNGAPYASFTFQVQDDGGTQFGGVDTDPSANTMTIDVAAVADAPVAPATNSVATDEDTPSAPVAIGASDADGDISSYKVKDGAGPAKGSVIFYGDTFVYTPAPHANGADSFTIVVRDKTGLTTEQVVSVAIAPVADAPAAIDDTLSPGAGGQIATALILANDVDVDGDPISVIAVANAVGGAVSLSGSTITFTPTPGHAGAYGFDYTIGDGTGLTDSAHVTLTGVAGGGGGGNGGGNQPPVIAPVAPLVTFTGIAAALQVSASDADGDPLTFGATGAAHGDVTGGSGGAFVYTPDAGYAGADSFTVTAGDGNGGSASGAVAVSVIELPTAIEWTVHAPARHVGEVGGTGLYVGTRGFQEVTVLDLPGLVTFDETAALANPARIYIAAGSQDYGPVPGGSATELYGSNAAERVSLAADANVALDASFVRDNDVVAIAGNASDYAISSTLAGLVVTSAAGAYIRIPSFAAGGGLDLEFADTTLHLGTEDGASFTIGTQAITPAPLLIGGGAPGGASSGALVYRGGDLVHLPGDAGEWRIVKTDGGALLTDGDTHVLIPLGQSGVLLAFDDGARTLAFDPFTGQDMIGTQALGAVLVPVTAPAQAIALPAGGNPALEADLMLEPDGEVTLGGTFAVTGTASAETVHLLGGMFRFDDTFGHGNDTITFDAATGAFTALRDSASLVLDSTTLDAKIPGGASGTTLAFANEDRDLVYLIDTDTMTLGAQTITTIATPLIA